MAHAYSSHRNTGSKRAATFLKSGGAAHSDAAADKKLISKMLKAHEKTEGDAHGGRVTPGRLDKNYARGGRTKHHKKPHLQVNIINKGGKDEPTLSDLANTPPIAAPAGGASIAAGGPPPAALGAASLGVPAGPLPPPAAAPPVGQPGPAAKHGGRIPRKQGGGPLAIRPGAMPMLRGPMGRFKSGGYVSGISTKGNLDKWANYSKKGSPTPKRARGGRMTGGAETGVGRLEKAAKYKRGS